MGPDPKTWRPAPAGLPQEERFKVSVPICCLLLELIL